MKIFFSQVIGEFIYFFSHRRNKVALKHLDLAYQNEIDLKHKTGIIKASYSHFVKSSLDLLLSDPVKDETLVTVSDQSKENFIRAFDQGQGVILFTGHLGNWEFGIPWISRHCHNQLHVVVKDLKPLWLNKWATGKRAELGAAVIRKQEAAKGVLRALKQGDVIAILVDQNRPDGVFVPFFGRPAGTSPLVATMARRTGAQAVPSCCFRKKDGSYELWFGEPLHFEEYESQQKSIEKGTELCNQILEGLIKEHPEQWLWSHRRFKSCQEGQRPLYDD